MTSGSSGTVNLREIVLLKANRETRKRPISGHLQRFPVSSEASKLLKLTVPLAELGAVHEGEWLRSIAILDDKSMVKGQSR